MFAHRLWFAAFVAGLALLVVPSAASAAAPTCDAGPYLYDLPAGLTHVHPRAPCTDPDGDAISVQVSVAPQFGTLEPAGAAPIDQVRYYTANADAGERRDTMTFVAVAGGETSNPFTADVVIKPPNHVPVCADVAVTVPRGAPIAIPAPQCTDADGDAFQIVFDKPSHGTFDASNRRYVSAAGFTGQDTISFVAVDDWDTLSAKGTVKITVTADGPKPPAPPASSSTDRRAPRLKFEAPSALASRLALSSGIPFTATTNEIGHLTVLVYVDRKSARRYGLARNPAGRVLVGTLRRTVTAGDTTARVKLTRKARNRLEDVRVKLSLVARITDAAGNSRAERLKMTLKR